MTCFLITVAVYVLICVLLLLALWLGYALGRHDRAAERAEKLAAALADQKTAARQLTVNLTISDRQRRMGLDRRTA